MLTVAQTLTIILPKHALRAMAPCVSHPGDRASLQHVAVHVPIDEHGVAASVTLAATDTKVLAELTLDAECAFPSYRQNRPRMAGLLEPVILRDGDGQVLSDPGLRMILVPIVNVMPILSAGPPDEYVTITATAQPRDPAWACTITGRDSRLSYQWSSDPSLTFPKYQKITEEIRARFATPPLAPISAHSHIRVNPKLLATGAEVAKRLRLDTERGLVLQFTPNERGTSELPMLVQWCAGNGDEVFAPLTLIIMPMCELEGGSRGRR